VNNIPLSSSCSPEEVLSAFENHMNPALAQVMRFIGFEAVEASAQGCVVTDTTGRQYLDCLGGYGTMSVGYSHPRVIDAVKMQLDQMAFSAKVLFSAPAALLAKKLAEIAPGDLEYVFFCNSGTEAAEAAMKLARLKTKRTKMVAAVGAFHGKTMGALSVSGREKYKTPFQPLVPDCATVPYNDIAALEAAVDETVAAVFLEPVQGEAGIILCNPDYLRAAREICNRHGALLVFDEVQTGLGRTGKMWGCDHAAVVPDLMTLAKALSGGMVPIGAVLGTANVWEVWQENPLIHSSTFGGNPLACAAGLAAIDVIEEENLVSRAQEQGQKILDGIRGLQEKYPRCIHEVRGVGLMIGIEFTHADIAGLVIAGLAQRDVLAAYTLNNPTVIRLEPPLIITDEQVQTALTAFEESVEQTALLVEDESWDENGS
jgi:putrescine aminotransferase